MRRLTRILSVSLSVTLSLAATWRAAEVRGPKQKPQTLILEFDKGDPTTKPAAATKPTAATKPKPATKPAPLTKQRGLGIGRSTSAPAGAASSGDPTDTAADATPRPIDAKREISKTAAMIVVCIAGVVGVILAVVRKRRDSAY